MKTSLACLLFCALVAPIILACTSGTQLCQTAYATCRTEAYGKVGYPCVCRYESNARPGIYIGDAD